MFIFQINTLTTHTKKINIHIYEMVSKLYAYTTLDRKKQNKEEDKTFIIITSDLYPSITK